ncbi:MAG: rhomboid family intramembrane serine protease [Pirellulales bacterium]
MFVPCIPWNTDAPVDHRPYGTLGLIALDVYLFFADYLPQWAAAPGMAFERWALPLGVLNPFFWLAANVSHGDWVRLLLDVVFLWSFGLIVEGKLGWYRFVPVYFLLAIGHAQLVERLAVALQPYTDVPLVAADVASSVLGSTAIVYAVGAMAFVWAPKNDVRCVAWIWIKGYVYDIPIPALLCVFILGDAGLGWLAASPPALAFSHAVGFAIGIAAAALLMLLRQVNCQGWDLFSVMCGRTGDVDLEEMRQYQHRPDVQSGLDDDYFARRHHAGMEILRTHLANRDATAALELHHRMSAKLKDWQLPEVELAALAQLLNERHSFPASIPLMFEYLRRFPDHSGPMRLELAAILMHEENRPGKAVGVLERIVPGSLPDELIPTRDDLLREAHEKAVDGEIELEDDV